MHRAFLDFVGRLGITAPVLAASDVAAIAEAVCGVSAAHFLEGLLGPAEGDPGRDALRNVLRFYCRAVTEGRVEDRVWTQEALGSENQFLRRVALLAVARHGLLADQKVRVTVSVFCVLLG